MKLDYAARAIAFVILAQTLYFKFTADPESVQIFSALEAEPWGRIFSGIVELAACVLLVFPRTVALGALIGSVTMLGALGAHIFKLGIDVGGDGGLLFLMAFTTLVCCAYSLWSHRKHLPGWPV